MADSSLPARFIFADQPRPSGSERIHGVTLCGSSELFASKSRISKLVGRSAVAWRTTSREEFDIDPRQRTNWLSFGEGAIERAEFFEFIFLRVSRRGGQLRARKEGINPGKEVEKEVEITSSRIATG